MKIVTKAVAATIEDTSSSEDEFPGTFLVELSNETRDRDGETLKAADWETPLPQQIPFVNDHTHKVKSVVGSATPELVGGRIVCKGEWAADAESQDTRKKIKHVPYVSVAYAEKRMGGKTVRELLNGSFVVVPSNPTARVLASKSVGDLDDDTPIADLTIKQFTELLATKGFSQSTDEAPPKDADPDTDPAKSEAAALALKAAADEIIHRTTV